MNKRNANGFWVMQAPVISEGHLTEDVHEALMGTLPGEDFNGALCLIGGHGALVRCDDIDLLSKGAPACLRKSLEWAKGEGFEWVRFDTDGDVIAALELHDW